MPEEQAGEIVKAAEKPGQKIVEALQAKEIPAEVALVGIKREFWERQLRSAAGSITRAERSGVPAFQIAEAELTGVKERYAEVYAETQDFILEHGPQASGQLFIVSSTLLNTGRDDLLGAAQILKKQTPKEWK